MQRSKIRREKVTALLSTSFLQDGRRKLYAVGIVLERNANLRDFYLYNLSAFRSYHLVYINELG